MAKENKPMVNNTLYLIELEMGEHIDYNEQKVLELSEDFLKAHKVYAVPVLHRADGAYWSESLGHCKGYCNRFRFKLASVSLSYIDNVARYFGCYRRLIPLLPTDVGMRVFYAPFRVCKITMTGKDPLRHTCHLFMGPVLHPFYYANVGKNELDAVARDLTADLEAKFYAPPPLPDKIKVERVERSAEVYQSRMEKLHQRLSQMLNSKKK